MKIDRSIEDILQDLCLLTEGINKLYKIEVLVERKGWYSYDEFVDNLRDILDIEDY